MAVYLYSSMSPDFWSYQNLPDLATLFVPTTTPSSLSSLPWALSLPCLEDKPLEGLKTIIATLVLYVTRPPFLILNAGTKSISSSLMLYKCSQSIMCCPSSFNSCFRSLNIDGVRQGVIYLSSSLRYSSSEKPQSLIKPAKEWSCCGTKTRFWLYRWRHSEISTTWRRQGRGGSRRALTLHGTYRMDWKPSGGLGRYNSHLPPYRLWKITLPEIPWRRQLHTKVLLFLHLFLSFPFSSSVDDNN